MRGEVTLRVVARVRVLTAPVVTTRRQLVRRQGAGSWRETETRALWDVIKGYIISYEQDIETFNSAITKQCL